MWRITVLVIVALVMSLPVQAKPKKDRQHKAANESTLEQGALDRGETFSPAERNLIRAYLLGGKHTTSVPQSKDLPPGLQKKVARGKPLPPGWQKKVEPGQSLDYQVYRQSESLPEILLKRLPPPPVGAEVIRINEKVILLNSTSHTILDFFDLAPSR